MPIEPPTSDDLAQIAERYGIHAGPGDLESYRALAAGLLASYDEVERRYGEVEQSYAESLPPAHGRDHHQPSPPENRLGAWYVTTDIRTREDGPLAGRRVAVKDNIAVAGVPMMNGSAALEGFVPRRDATVVTRLLDAGATIAGKAVCENLCFSGGSHTALTGPVRNPWDLNRTAGGSSSGSAALVAAGDADLALGGDQGGSIRIPSSFCGTVGHKPTHGLVPYTGAFPIENTLDHLGPITRTVADAALMLGVLAGPDGLDPRQRGARPGSNGAGLGGDGARPGGGGPVPDYAGELAQGAAGLTIGVLAEGFGFPGLSQPEVDAVVRDAIARLERAGASVRPVSVPWHHDAMHLWTVIATDGVVTQMIDGNGFGMNWQGRYDPEQIEHYARGRARHADKLPETVKVTTFAGRYAIDRYHGRHYAMARNLVPHLTTAYDAALAGVDVLALPTLPIVATPIPPASATREESIARSTEMIVNTAPFDVTGHPATSVPAGLVGGLPAGLMFVGRHFADATCLRAAHALETAVGGFPSPPGSS